VNRPPSSSSNPSRQAGKSFRADALASGIVTAAELAEAEAAIGTVPADKVDAAVADELVRRELLTRFQADQILEGKRKLTLGYYRILDAVGQGGMGQVFKARHLMMGRIVAVKVLPRAKSNADTEAAFRREILHIASLDHRNLVYALDAGHDGKVYYLVTELVDGIDLRRQVLRYGPLDEWAAASVIAQAALGLGHAHAKGFVHRDVKPGNLLVREDGLVKVSDLGLAGSLLDPESLRPGRIVGTMDYMAPEQIRRPDAVRPAADIYGLGCTLYFTLAGRVPFPGGSRDEKRKQQLRENPEPISSVARGVSPEFAGVVERMMIKDPDERLQSAEAVIEAVRPWLTGELVPMSRVKRSRRRRGGLPPPPLPSTLRATQAGSRPSEETHRSGGGPLPELLPHTPPPATTASGFLSEAVSGFLGRSRAAAGAVAGSIAVAAGFALALAVLRLVFGPRLTALLERLDLGGITPLKTVWYVFLLMMLVQLVGGLRFRRRAGGGHRGGGRHVR